MLGVESEECVEGVCGAVSEKMEERAAFVAFTFASVGKTWLSEVIGLLPLQGRTTL